MSPGRASVIRRSPMTRSIASPPARPSASLIGLKPSRLMNSSASRRWCRSARCTSRARCSSNCWRFGSPVSASRVAVSCCAERDLRADLARGKKRSAMRPAMRPSVTAARARAVIRNLSVFLVRPEATNHSFSVQKADAATLPYLRLHAVLGFELREEFVRLERFAEHVDLALDGREVPRRERIELAQPLALLVAEQRRVAA